ncbi:metal ABC transporter substrate-binding protein [Scytonema sp. UIC 10036]|uniref:metal ABC transporter solute-binding protein, Zn/Mn family n=1 Tax=Scytonema sp. UIC 10036 TaxID=2304196 RepID=UPI0012DA78F8|nr:zinc ABC transporter substrate-binding protein [Scytonema sp. UIC 10036]MUG98498.1 metal ABC transporter substrate-binding protein [Scytonema sp. UIC 10036]
MIKKLLLTQSLQTLLIALTIGFFGCNNPNQVTNIASVNTAASDELTNTLPKVVATTSILCDLTKQIARETINLTCLIPSNSNPLIYEAKPEDGDAIAQAQLILYNGFDLEPNLVELIRTRNNSGLRVAVAQRAVSKPIKVKVGETTVTNPYAWHNAKNVVGMVEVVTRNLSKTVPENESLYNDNAEKIKQELNQLHTWITARIESIPENHRKLIATRNAMAYYAKAYDLNYAVVLRGSNSEGTPTSKRTKALSKYIRKYQIPALFTETTNNSNAIAIVAEQANVRVSERQLFVDSLGEPGTEADTYQKMMVANTRTIVEGLGGTYLIFEPTPIK